MEFLTRTSSVHFGVVSVSVLEPCSERSAAPNLRWGRRAHYGPCTINCDPIRHAFCLRQSLITHQSIDILCPLLWSFGEPR